VGEVGEVLEEVVGFGGGEGVVEGVLLQDMFAGGIMLGELGDEVGEDDGADPGAVRFADQAHSADGVDIVDGVDDQSHIALLHGVPKSIRGAYNFDPVDRGTLFAWIVIQNPNHAEGACQVGPVEHPECHLAIVASPDDEHALGDGSGMTAGTDPARGSPGDETLTVTNEDKADETEHAGGDDHADGQNLGCEHIVLEESQQAGGDRNRECQLKRISRRRP